MMYTISLSIDGKVNIAGVPVRALRGGHEASHSVVCGLSNGSPERELQARSETSCARRLCSGSTSQQSLRRCSGAPQTHSRPAPEKQNLKSVLLSRAARRGYANFVAKCAPT